ncbi:MAG: nucleotidyl transferase AbiEii/AbiGii toxin family protein, partial [Bacteroidota bacterium]
QPLQIDIGFGDVVTPGAVEMSYPTLINMESPRVLAYSIESMISEKFQAMVDLGEYNTRMKDFYDVYSFIISQKLNPEYLQEAIKNTFNKRNTAFNPNIPLYDPQFSTNETRNQQFLAFLKKSNLDTELNFEEVMQTITRYLKPIYDQLAEATNDQF